jgi:hypothetical protein
VENGNDVAAMLEKLGLSETDLDDVVFEEEVSQPEEMSRWMAVARVHMENEFSHFCFFKNMRSTWELAKDVNIQVIKENLFVMQFMCLCV